ncbi:6-carboxytetrahydropterin synthase [Shewanella sp. 202IG2-18]|uniref:6-pyruvoyl trahydropterin synthase family protein n=1 Tax=Parashewanella hymeniacidonis TaxID=2807618 RepID=UPI0019612A9D|nr:6-carboxytetrahydropterin synthase [Parashewanella hymeniacidonis]MBM7074083.1 6-carboxytetrahydropterin synthase [Parashewanella hymeniacidonis]
MDISEKRLTRIKLFKEYLKFSAAHFTLFSATERERIHGHNFAVQVELELGVGEEGISTSYRYFKDTTRELCESLDEYVLLPKLSPHLQISINTKHYVVTFNNEVLYFPITDTKLLPIRNTTVEEFSYYLLEKLISEIEPDHFDITYIEVTVSSGAGQSGSTTWTKE